MRVIPLVQPGPAIGDEDPVRARLKKAPTAFRTISEVADDLHIPQHVLRFWETKFTQVRPLKRGGGRRYYRPDDVALLRRIAHLLYTQGYTIKGVQRLLREGGGRLADDIPPPAQDELEREGEHDAHELAEPAGAAPEAPDLPEQRLPLRFIPRPGGALSGSALVGSALSGAQAAVGAPAMISGLASSLSGGERPPAGDPDAGETASGEARAGQDLARLHGVMRGILAELEALRRLL